VVISQVPAKGFGVQGGLEYRIPPLLPGTIMWSSAGICWLGARCQSELTVLGCSSDLRGADLGTRVVALASSTVSTLVTASIPAFTTCLDGREFTRQQLDVAAVLARPHPWWQRRLRRLSLASCLASEVVVVSLARMVPFPFPSARHARQRPYQPATHAAMRVYWSSGLFRPQSTQVLRPSSR
jgi:hypothetical protein